MNGNCDCANPVLPMTGVMPQTISNRPGLSALAYRAGTYATFMETMQGRLGYFYGQLASIGDGPTGMPSPPPMTRDPTDPAIALLDAWAIVADVLTFYQERIANEGYIRTATEPVSLQQLASLVGYVPKPGVAASVSVAYVVQDQGSDSVVNVPPGSRMQSLPVAGEIPKVFETAAAIGARASWSTLQPRMARAQQVTSDAGTVYVNGTSTKLKPNDPVLIVGNSPPTLRRIQSITVDAPNRRIALALQPVSAAMSQAAPEGAATASPATGDTTAGDASGAAQPAATPAAPAPSTGVAPAPAQATPRPVALSPIVNSAFTKALSRAPAAHPSNALSLRQSVSQSLLPTTDAAQQLLVEFNPALRGPLQQALRNTTIAPSPQVQVFAFNVHAAPFGNNAPLQTVFDLTREREGKPLEQTEWSLKVGEAPTLATAAGTGNAKAYNAQQDTYESLETLYLDNSYANIVPGSWVAVCGVDDGGVPIEPFISQIDEVHNIARTAYGLAAKSTRLKLNQPWFKDPGSSGQSAFRSVIRGSLVYAQSEPLDLSEAPVADPVSGASLELDDLYDGLTPGQWMFVSGVRVDTPGTSGVTGAELVMLQTANHTVETVASANTVTASDGNTAASVSNASVATTANANASAANPPALLPGGRMRTTLTLSSTLGYQYDRSSVTVNGNVAMATHGQTHTEILGSGDGRAAFRNFSLRNSPLTYVSAPTPSGVQSTLQITVNGVSWQEVKSFQGAGATDRVFVSRALKDGTTQVTFGNGTQGANLPSGVENIQATYRTGIGTDGNCDAGQISQTVSRPLGVMSVVNPIAASGGADPESGDDIRRNATQGLAALDRLVSVADYEDFCRNFAGVRKASAVEIIIGTERTVHVTIAATDDAPVTSGAPLLDNLSAALAQCGDPHLPVRVEPRDALLLVISARVKVLDDSDWTDVSPQVSAALQDAFSFVNRELGKSVALSEVLAVIQGVPGVAYVEIDVFDRVAEDAALADMARIAGAAPTPVRQSIEARLAHRRRGVRGAFSVQAAQIAYLSPDVPATLTLTEIVS